MKKIVLIFFMLTYFGIAYSSEKITVFTEEWAPFNYLENDKPAGISVDIAKEMMKITGISGEIEVVPWARAYTQAITRENVMIFTIARTEERENKFKWIGKVGEKKMYFFKLKSRKDINLKNLGEAKKYMTGVVNNDVSEVELLKKGFKHGVNLDKAVTEDANVRKFFAKRVDLLLGAEQDTIYLCQKLKYDCSVIQKLNVVVYDGEYYIAFSKETSDEIVEKFRAAFEELKKDGTLNKITNKYISQ